MPKISSRPSYLHPSAQVYGRKAKILAGSETQASGHRIGGEQIIGGPHRVVPQLAPIDVPRECASPVVPAKLDHIVPEPHQIASSGTRLVRDNSQDSNRSIDDNDRSSSGRPSRTFSRPLIVVEHRYHKVPLPSDTDPTFRIPLYAAGKLGVQVAESVIHLSDDLLLAQIMRAVDNATESLDDVIQQDAIYMHRALFALETTKVVPFYLAKEPKRGFTLGHLLVPLLRKQISHWTKLPRRRRVVECLVGTDAVEPAQGSKTVSWSSVYITAIRRRAGYYFLELRVRIDQVHHAS
ncbi:hypothetical protein C8Q73DRAFT_795380 [Cubamyces lactineus]|nr:hypothetical protein C8Q73DRAFT_795380 [Cubamyces lactineus]